MRSWICSKQRLHCNVLDRFAGTFFPISIYPEWLRVIVEFTPLYRGVHMMRAFTTGTIDSMVLVDIAYLSIMGLIGIVITSRRLRILLLK